MNKEVLIHHDFTEDSIEDHPHDFTEDSLDYDTDDDPGWYPGKILNLYFLQQFLYYCFVF